MSSNKYIPPSKRNTDTKASMQPNQQNRRPYRKPQWEIAEEQRAAKDQLRVTAEEEMRKNIELTEDNFPALGEPASKVTVWGGTKSFAALAVEWDEQSKMEEKQQDNSEESTTVFRRRNVLPLPQFHNVHRFIEPEDYQEDEQPSKPTPVEDDGWITVDRRKYRRQKTIEEKLARPPTPDQNDGSVWNDQAQEEHDTCWDERY